MDIKRKRPFCLIFTIILCLSVMPVMSFAAEDARQPAAEEGNDNYNNDNSDSNIENGDGIDDNLLNPDDADGTDDGYDDTQGDGQPGDSGPEGGTEGTESAGESPETGNGSDADSSGAGEGSNEDTPVSANPYHIHQYVASVTEPTCTEKGYTTYICSCGDSYVDDYTEPLNHPGVIEFPEVPATFESGGMTAGKKCGICGETLEGCEEIPPLTEISREFDKSVITGFDITEPWEIREEVKPILDELMERLPNEITIFLGGTLTYKMDEASKPDDAGDADKTNDSGNSESAGGADNTDSSDQYVKGREEAQEEEEILEGAVPGVPEGADKKTIKVTWVCREDYDESLPVFEFIPELEDYELAPGIELPIQKVYIESEADGPVGGHIPTGIEDVPFAISNRKALPGASFNAYESGWLPPVRNQGSEGACWSFAAIGAIEADLIRGGWDRNTIDLSELYLAYYAINTYPDPKSCNTGDRAEYRGSARYLSNGGNNCMSYRTMANMVGPVAEATAPYPNGSPEGPNVAQMTGAYLYNPEDRNGIKAAILAHGGVDAAIYWDGASYSSTYNSYYYPYKRANHEVMLVGWDDSFSASHFRSGYQPGKGNDGAWLVRNSWGYQGYGSSGYFWLSYYDGGLLSDVVTAYDAEAPRYDSCYAYDSIPYPEAERYLSAGQEVSQSFILKGAEVIRAVGFETGGSNVTATVKVSNGQVVSTSQVYAGNEGFYIAELGAPMTCAAGQTITVSLSFSRASSIMYEDEGTDTAGEAYYASHCGGGGFTVGGWTYPCDARIKLFTDNDSSGGQIPVESINLSASSMNLLVGNHEQLYVTLSPENAYGTFSWKSTNPAVARVDQGLVMGVSAGEADIIVTAGNGVSASCHVTVSTIRVRGITINGFSSNPKTTVIPDTGDNSWVDIPSSIPLSLTYKTNPLNATNQAAAWTSSNPSVAYVKMQDEGSSGRKEALVYLKDAGTAVITVISADGGYSDTLTIKITKTMCTLTYNANGGSGAPASQRYSRGAEIKLQSGTPSRSGYIFKGWAAASNSSTAQYQPGSSYTISKNTTLYAVWQDNRKKCTLSFNANGGTGAPAAQTVYVGSTVTLPADRPSRPGYTFKGWATAGNASSAQYQPGSSYKANGNVVFYALWANDQKVIEYVRRCYRTILGREGENMGVNYWASLICSGARDGASIVGEFLKSTEFVNKNYSKDQVVTILYRSMFGREPESSGKAYWLKFLDDGASLSYVVAGFAGSVEFNNVCSYYGISSGTIVLTENRDRNIRVTQFVNRNYVYALNRRGEPSGLNYWTGKLLSKEQTPKQVSYGFVFSKECINKNLSNRDFIYMLYRLYLGREPEPTGLNYWLNILDSGRSRQDVANGFADSVEFQGIVRSFGL